jgi:predicted dehydrogenase
MKPHSPRKFHGKTARRPRGRKIRLGVFGANRGQTMIRVLARHPDAELVAICDRYRPLLDRCRNIARGAGARITFYTDPEKFFEHDFDAVVLANYANEHAPWAIRALNSGRHAISEVVAVQTLDEAVRLAEAVEASGRVYAYAENYCYFRATQEMRRLYRRGDIGAFLHGEGEYVHNCVPDWPQIAGGDPDHWRNRMSSTFYCTHSLGPLIHITGERPVRVVGFETPNTTARTTGYRGGSSAMVLCQMSGGATVKSLHGVCLPREPSAIWYAVYGDKGMIESDRWGAMTQRVNLYIEGPRRGAPRLISYEPPFPFETELSRRTGGHGGSDFFTMHFFLEKILGRPGGANAVDVYAALDMTIPGILAYKSILDGNRPYGVPDMRDRAAREPCRGDFFCRDPKVAGAVMPPPCSFPTPETPARVFARQKALAEGRA